jgi:cell division protease FtsH
VGDNEQEVFLGNQIMSRREISERTHQLVDVEVKRVIDSAYALATRVLTENIELLHTVAAALLERETLTREDIEVLKRGDVLPPRPAPPPIMPAPSSVPLPHQPKPVAPPIIGGPEPSPA